MVVVIGALDETMGLAVGLLEKRQLPDDDDILTHHSFVFSERLVS
jgi:hypothetical protein